jgi:hypothetical protein
VKAKMTFTIIGVLQTAVGLFFSVCSFINFLPAKIKEGGRNWLGKQLEWTAFMISQHKLVPN